MSRSIRFSLVKKVSDWAQKLYKELIPLRKVETVSELTRKQIDFLHALWTAASVTTK